MDYKYKKFHQEKINLATTVINESVEVEVKIQLITDYWKLITENLPPIILSFHHRKITIVSAFGNFSIFYGFNNGTFGFSKV